MEFSWMDPGEGSGGMAAGEMGSRNLSGVTSRLPWETTLPGPCWADFGARHLKYPRGSKCHRFFI